MGSGIQCVCARCQSQTFAKTNLINDHFGDWRQKSGSDGREQTKGKRGVAYKEKIE